MDVPEFIDAEDVPVGASQERAEDDHPDPQRQEAEHEGDDRELPLIERVIAVSQLVEVDVRDGHHSAENHARKHDARQPRIVVDQHFLQAQEVPRSLRRIRRLHGRGGLFQRSLQCNAPENQERRHRDHADHFGVDEVRPRQHFFVVLGFDRRPALSGAAIILVGSVEEEPCEETDDEQHRHDRHVVRLADDLSEVPVGQADRQKQQRRIEQRPTDIRLSQPIAKDQHQNERECRDRKVIPSIRHHCIHRSLGAVWHDEPERTRIARTTKMHDRDQHQRGRVARPNRRRRNAGSARECRQFKVMPAMI